MLISKVSCPYGCVNSVMSETTKRVVTGNSNLLLDSAHANTTVTEVVKVYSCTCCGKSFESHQPQSTDGRMVI